MDYLSAIDKWPDIPPEQLAEITSRGECVVICYNSAEVWRNRDDALAFYLEAMQACEGCEASRYMSVYCDLVGGRIVCWDGVTEQLRREAKYR